MWRLILLALVAPVLILTPVLAQETEGNGPPPMIWAVPHIQLYNGNGSTNVLRGLDASLALPLSPRTNITATWFFDGYAEDYGSATFNYDHPLQHDVTLRGSAGMIRNDFGYGVTLHRAYENYGVGAFAQSVSGDFEAGVMLTREVPWGFKLGKVPLPRRSESTNWNSGSGNVGDLGACAALQLRSGNASELATTTAYFPERRQSWPREGHTVQSASYTSTDFAPPAKPAWRYQTEGAVRSSAAIVDGVAYVGSYDGWLYALDIGTGRRLWRFPAESAITGAPSVCDDQIFFGTESGDVFCVAQPRKNGPPTGQLVWRYNTSASVTASPLVTDSDLVIVGSCDSYIYALDRHTGRLVWKIATGGPVMASASKIGRRIPAGVDDTGKPTSRSASVLVGSSDGKLYAIEEVAGQTIWTFTSDGPITAAPVLYGDRLYLTNRSGSLYVLQPATGRQLWTQRIPGSIAHSPAVDDQRVYVGTTEGGVFALESLTGKMVWQCDLRATLAASPTLVSGQIMYLASRDGRLWAMDRPTGRVLNFHRESEPLTTCAAIADGHLLVGGDSGCVYAYVPSAGGLPLPPLDAADLPTPVRAVEPAASLPLPPVQPTTPATPEAPAVTVPTVPVQPATPVALPPTPSVVPAPPTVTPPAAAAQTIVKPAAPPQVVAVQPTPAVSLPPTELTAPKAPSTPAPVTTPRVDTPPTDFPSATVPLGGTLNAPTPAVVRPVAPLATPPAAPSTPATIPATPSAGPASTKVPLLTLLSTPADGRTPILLSNQSYLYIGGKVAAGSDIVAIRVNGLEAPIKDGAYQAQVTFPGLGDYLLLVEAISRGGERSTYRRAITVVEGADALSPNRMPLRLRGGSPMVMLAPGARGLQIARFTKTIEIRNAQGQLVTNWVLAGDDNSGLSWNGANASGKMVAPGNYEIVYILSGEHGPLAWLRQPVEVQE